MASGQFLGDVYTDHGPSSTKHGRNANTASSGASSSGPGPDSTSDTSQQAPPPLHPPPRQHNKRTRVTLSCAPCRISKLKCDRAQPCGQCVKKSRIHGCVYAPKPQKTRPARGLTARLKRLEGMVRGMMDDEERGPSPAGPVAVAGGPSDRGGASLGQVVLGGKGGTERTTTYVGATHFMAILDDIEDLKSYFDEDEGSEDGEPDLDPESNPAEMLMLSNGLPKSRREFLSYLPPRHIVDRLTMRYFNAYSPSGHTIHRSTFIKQYTDFWQNPDDTPLDWISLLYSMLALGVFYSSFVMPHELESDGDLPPMERFAHYRRLAAAALASSKYTYPGPTTPQSFMLYIEAEFLSSRGPQVKCYLLISVYVRLLLRMGMHRDPSKLSNISPFEGEIRRRLWNLAVQFDLIVSFHTGLPSMVHAIESDTQMPRNLAEDDLYEHCAELPPSRPDNDYTQLTYPIWKTNIARIFGLAAQQAHSLSVPAYSEVMRVDSTLQDMWRRVPASMKAKSIGNSIADPPHQVNQRYGLCSLYQKTRCVLHRGYLVEAVPQREHDYSRRACLDAALGLLHQQDTVYQATLPGGLLAQNAWFITSLAVYDYLLAAMVVYLVIQTDTYHEWKGPGNALPGKGELCDVLERSHSIWKAISQASFVGKKATDILGTMAKKIGELRSQGLAGLVTTSGAEMPGLAYGESALPGPGAEQANEPMLDLSTTGAAEQPQARPTSTPPFGRHTGPSSDFVPYPIPTRGVDMSWLPLATTEVDWASFDEAIQQSANDGTPMVDDFAQQAAQLDDVEYMAACAWTDTPGPDLH